MRPWRRAKEKQCDPLAWEEFQQNLLRLEQLVLSGEAYQAEYRETLRRANALADSRSRLAPGRSGRIQPSACPPRSAPTQATGGVGNAADLARAKTSESPPGAAPPPGGLPPRIRPRQNQRLRPRAASNAADGKPPGPSRRRPTKKPAKTAPPPKPDTPSEPKPGRPPTKPDAAPRIEAGYRPGVETERQRFLPEVAPAQPKGLIPTSPLRSRLAELAEQPPIRREFQPSSRLPTTRHGCADVRELHLLRLLQANLDWDTSPGTSPWLVANGLMEEAAAAEDRRAIFWTERPDRPGSMPAATRQRPPLRRVSESLAEAKRLWQRPSAMVGQGYQFAAARAGQVAEAYRLRDRAWRLAPYRRMAFNAKL